MFRIIMMVASLFHGLLKEPLRFGLLIKGSTTMPLTYDITIVLSKNQPLSSVDKGEYHNTSLAHHGDQGSKLPEFPTGTIWKAGGTAEVNLISVLKLFLSNMSFCSVITEYETTSRTPVLTSLPKLTSALSLS